LQDHERDDAAVNVANRHARRHDSLEVEKREAHGWCEERSLQHQRYEDEEPGHVQTRELDHRGKQGKHDQDDLEPIEEKASHKHDEQHYENKLMGA